MQSSKNAFVCLFLFSNFDDVTASVNSIVRTSMEKLAVIWEECGFSDTSIQQRCEAVKKHVQVNIALRFSFKFFGSMVFAFQKYLYFMLFVLYRVVKKMVIGFLNSKKHTERKSLQRLLVLRFGPRVAVQYKASECKLFT